MKTSNISKKPTNNEIWTDECEVLLAEWSEKHRVIDGYMDVLKELSYLVLLFFNTSNYSTLTGAANVGMILLFG